MKHHGPSIEYWLRVTTPVIVLLIPDDAVPGGYWAKSAVFMALLVWNGRWVAREIHRERPERKHTDIVITEQLVVVFFAGFVAFIALLYYVLRGVL